MRILAVVTGVIASAAWALFALAYAAWRDIEGIGESSEVVAGLAVAAIGIGCLLVALRRVWLRATDSASVMLVVAALAFVAWLAIGPPSI